MVLAPVEASSQEYGVYGLLGFNAEAEFDDVSFSNDNGALRLDGDEDEDLEDNLGVLVLGETELGSGLAWGGMAKLVFAEGDESDGNYTTLDLGVSGRWRAPVKSFDLDLVGAIGPSVLFLADLDDPFDDYSFLTLGYHLTAGVFASKKVGSVTLSAGLLLSRESYADTEDEDNIDPFGDVTIEFEDGVMTRGYLVLGARFGG